MKKRFELILNEEQLKLLEKKTKAYGLTSKSEYIRYVLFIETRLSEKIDAIYDKFIENG